MDKNPRIAEIEKTREKLRENLRGTNLGKALDQLNQKLKSKGFSDTICDAVQDAYKEYIDLILFGCNKSLRLEIVNLKKRSRSKK